jgi:hypothetical protein
MERLQFILLSVFEELAVQDPDWKERVRTLMEAADEDQGPQMIH